VEGKKDLGGLQKEDPIDDLAKKEKKGLKGTPGECLKKKKKKKRPATVEGHRNHRPGVGRENVRENRKSKGTQEKLNVKAFVVRRVERGQQNREMCGETFDEQKD